jgi:hypothetical protein
MAEELCERMIEKCHEVIPALYDDTDRDREYIEVQNRQGRLERFPLLSVSIGVATTDRRDFTHPGELVSVATELKEFAKRTVGSTYLFDRRSDRGERIPPGSDDPAGPPAA